MSKVFIRTTATFLSVSDTGTLHRKKNTIG
jgi:hypothetical protein